MSGPGGAKAQAHGAEPPPRGAQEQARRAPGDFLLHPLALALLGLWACNDHLFKAAWPGWWTGKLSDVASLAVFPLLATAAWELLARRLGWRWWRSRPLLWAMMLATGAVMVGINLWDSWAWGYRHGLAVAQWPARALLALARQHPLPRLAPVSLTMDPTDLWTLPALALAAWIHRRHRR